MDFTNLMQGGLATIIGIAFGLFLTRFYDKKDKDVAKCESHKERIDGINTNLYSIETELRSTREKRKEMMESFKGEINRLDTAVADIKEEFRDLRKDIKELRDEIKECLISIIEVKK